MKRFAYAMIAALALGGDAFGQASGGGAALVDGNSRFAFDLYRELAATPGNVFFSPYSISTALAMTSVGARGETESQMAKTLHFPFEPARLHPTYRALIGETNGVGRKRAYQLSVANALWGQKGFGFAPAFLKTTRENYGAGLQEVDYVRSAEAARQSINSWVEKQTANKIKDLIPPGIVDQSTRLVLTNAIYFKASWLGGFEKQNTKVEAFHLADGKNVKVPMMRRGDSLSYFEEDGFQALELPYENHDLSMIVVLPKAPDGLARLEKGLSNAEFGRIAKGMRPHHVDVKLPRFKVTAQFKLKETLSKLGMAIAFSDGADFKGMTTKSTDELRISEVIHKAFVDVDEKGTEAAAATAVVMMLGGVPVRLQNVAFHADRPFLFVLRDNRTGSILFMGRLADPAP